MSSRTRVRIEDGIAFITIDDGKVNALSTELIAEVGEAFDAAEAAGAVAVLRGRAGIFLPASIWPRSSAAPTRPSRCCARVRG